MNLLNYLGPAKNELELAIKQCGFETLEDFMKGKAGDDLSQDARVSYHLGRVNLIAEILEELKQTIGDEEE
tara:strand:- start:958 stop:1170 length:213 start_codon:yes stop_codon:yes gene_type:complete